MLCNAVSSYRSNAAWLVRPRRVCLPQKPPRRQNSFSVISSASGAWTSFMALKMCSVHLRQGHKNYWSVYRLVEQVISMQAPRPHKSLTPDLLPRARSVVPGRRAEGRTTGHGSPVPYYIFYLVVVGRIHWQLGAVVVDNKQVFIPSDAR
jgi:hypothetical protein